MIAAALAASLLAPAPQAHAQADGQSPDAADDQSPNTDGQSPNGADDQSPNANGQSPNANGQSPNAAPTVTTAELAHDENVDLTDPLELSDPDEGDEAAGLAWGFEEGGVDNDRFDPIIGNDGRLRFRAAPDYENPDDADRDGVYEIKVSATTGSGDRALGSQPQDVRITLRNVNEEPSGEPTITGAAQVGETLTADTSGITDPDGLTSPTYSPQWILVDGSTDPPTETGISGATAATYTLAATDAGHKIKVRFTFTDDGGFANELTSAATETVSAPSRRPARRDHHAGGDRAGGDHLAGGDRAGGDRPAGTGHQGGDDPAGTGRRRSATGALRRHLSGPVHQD